VKLDLTGLVKRVKFHFRQTTAEADEWIEFGSERIFALYSKVPQKTKGPKIPDEAKSDPKEAGVSPRNGVTDETKKVILKDGEKPSSKEKKRKAAKDENGKETKRPKKKKAKKSLATATSVDPSASNRPVLNGDVEIAHATESKRTNNSPTLKGTGPVPRPEGLGMPGSRCSAENASSVQSNITTNGSHRAATQSSTTFPNVVQRNISMQDLLTLQAFDLLAKAQTPVYPPAAPVSEEFMRQAAAHSTRPSYDTGGHHYQQHQVRSTMAPQGSVRNVVRPETHFETLARGLSDLMAPPPAASVNNSDHAALSLLALASGGIGFDPQNPRSSDLSPRSNPYGAQPNFSLGTYHPPLHAGGGGNAGNNGGNGSATTAGVNAALLRELTGGSGGPPTQHGGNNGVPYPDPRYGRS